MAQRRLPVGIGEAAHVEHEIGVARNPVLVAEGFEHEREAPVGAAVDALADQLAQRVHPHGRGVDHQIRRRDDRLQELALGWRWPRAGSPRAETSGCLRRVSA